MKIQSLLDRVEKGILFALSIIFFVMVASIFSQIVMRFIFHNANSWSEELTRYTFVWLTLLGASVAVRRGRHMKVDFFIDMIPKNIAKAFKILTNILILGFFLVVIKYGIDLVGITYKQLSAGLEIPMAYAYLAIPVGGIFMLIFTIESYFIKDTNNNSVEED